MFAVEVSAQPDKRRRLGRIAAVLVVGALPVALVLRTAALEPPGRSPAEYVVAQGIADLAPGPLVWRVADVALDIEGTDDVTSGDPGFVLAQGSMALIIDDETGEGLILNGEEAAFVPAGREVVAATWSSDQPLVTTITVLPPENASDAGEARYVGDEFESDGGRYDLDLVAGHLDRNESTWIGPVSGVNLPVLVLVQRGTVVVSEDDVELATIEEGSASSIPLDGLIDPGAIGDAPRLEVAAQEGEASFVAAVFGWSAEMFGPIETNGQ
jgi:hypothetical protein